MTLELDGMSISSVILLISAGLTLGMALPAMIARRRSDSVWPLVWLRNAALVFTLAIMSYQLDLAARAVVPPEAWATAPSGSAP